MFFLRENKIPLAILFSGVIIALAIYFGLREKGNIQNKKTFVSQTSSLSPTEIATQTPILTLVSVPTEVITPSIYPAPYPSFR